MVCFIKKNDFVLFRRKVTNWSANLIYQQILCLCSIFIEQETRWGTFMRYGSSALYFPTLNKALLWGKLKGAQCSASVNSRVPSVRLSSPKNKSWDCQALLDFSPVKHSCVWWPFHYKSPLDLSTVFVNFCWGPARENCFTTGKSDWSERKTKIWPHQITVNFVKFHDFVTLT